ncbi:MAG: peptidylprolyl isomerase [Candidatus Cloacimonadaceae bacterium]|nr:peptidylprolyl isomerase [Candidatus Cloacimonadaceae bacterium]MDP3113888.1 peptidylprolyl isomerase [Candidatus Cloacimonadaceae bacterium]
MFIFAKVFDITISEDEVKRESKRLIGASESEELTIKQALSRLIDECILFHEAIREGFEMNECEFDAALLESLEDMDNTSIDCPMNMRQAEELEQSLKRRIVVRKYMRALWEKRLNIGEAELNAFYEDQKEVFFAPETVRASHILIKKDSEDALARISELRASIKSSEDFLARCNQSECPSNIRCGDLGYFPRGKMIREIEEVAFSLELNQISDVFSSPFGYHIIMLTERVIPHQVPLDEIRESLRTRLAQLEREFFLIRHISELRSKHESAIDILVENYKEA